ncbi:MAG: urea amidolyase, partial [Alphaproteobacteria bacterium]|nr:urea amidolyase [Alphaproteobacteria bacterium]MBU1560139.1 urea amidolyase [Alphaproteobacteria bacterium]
LSPITTPAPAPPVPSPTTPQNGPIRIIWGLHADLFSPAIRQRFLKDAFAIGRQHDRMGIRLVDPAAVFVDASSLSLVSEAIVPGDIQILGDGTPIVLMRDHQPTGGYPRIATVISADLDRLAQLRPAAPLSFISVTPDHAQSLLRSHQP